MTVFGDFGTTWTKFFNGENSVYSVVRTQDLSECIMVEIGTGHNAEKKSKQTANELIALSHGGLALVKERDFVVLDVGSRDMKYIHMINGSIASMDWNTNCGALTGFTLELLGKYFSIDFRDTCPSQTTIPVTCGLLGIERIFDMIAGGSSIQEGVSSFTKGLAQNAHRFINKRRKFYLSGGMCDNALFMSSFSEQVEIVPLGRFVLIEGLKRIHSLKAD